MRGAEFAIAFEIPFLQEIGQPLIAVFDAFIGGDAAKDFAILFIRRVANFNFMAQAAQEGFVHQIFWGQVRGKDDKHVERDFHFAPGVQAQIIETVFQRDDPAIEQIARANLLAAEVVNEQDAAIGFDLERGFVKFGGVVENKVEAFKREFAADDDEGATNFQPAWVAAHVGA